MKPAALHDRIRQDVEERIMSGAWAPGSRIPPEHELMTDYRCSRMTVSKAISALADRGLIERRKRAGSFVAAPTVHRAKLEIPEISVEIESQGMEHGLDLLERAEREGSQHERDLLAMRRGPVLALSCLHRADRRPFALEDRLINLSMVPRARDVDFASQSPGRWLLTHIPWTEAEHTISAVAATSDIAFKLDLPVGAPCLMITRWTWRTSERITYVRQIYPGDHAFTARFLA